MYGQIRLDDARDERAVLWPISAMTAAEIPFICGAILYEYSCAALVCRNLRRQTDPHLMGVVAPTKSGGDLVRSRSDERPPGSTTPPSTPTFLAFLQQVFENYYLFRMAYADPATRDHCCEPIAEMVLINLNLLEFLRGHCGSAIFSVNRMLSFESVKSLVGFS